MSVNNCNIYLESIESGGFISQLKREALAGNSLAAKRLYKRLRALLAMRSFDTWTKPSILSSMLNSKGVQTAVSTFKPAVGGGQMIEGTDINNLIIATQQLKHSGNTPKIIKCLANGKKYMTQSKCFIIDTESDVNPKTDGSRQKSQTQSLSSDTRWLQFGTDTTVVKIGEECVDFPQCFSERPVFGKSYNDSLCKPSTEVKRRSERPMRVVGNISANANLAADVHKRDAGNSSNRIQLNTDGKALDITESYETTSNDKEDETPGKSLTPESRAATRTIRTRNEHDHLAQCVTHCVASVDEDIPSRSGNNPQMRYFTAPDSHKIEVSHNKRNTMNHRIHAILWCPIFLLFLFMFSLPGIIFMQKSDDYLERHLLKEAKLFSIISKILFIIGGFVAIGFYTSLVLFFAVSV